MTCETCAVRMDSDSIMIGWHADAGCMIVPGPKPVNLFGLLPEVDLNLMGVPA